MYERLKMIREENNMSQSEFAKMLGMGQSTLAMMEVGKRDILDRHVKTICSIFNVREEWLRYGEGKMHVQTVDDFVERFAAEAGISDNIKGFIRCYFNLGSEQRKLLDGVLASLTDMWSNAPGEAESLSVVKAIDKVIESEQEETPDNVAAEKAAFMERASDLFDSEKNRASQALSVKESGVG